MKKPETLYVAQILGLGFRESMMMSETLTQGTTKFYQGKSKKLYEEGNFQIDLKYVN